MKVMVQALQSLRLSPNSRPIAAPETVVKFTVVVIADPEALAIFRVRAVEEPETLVKFKYGRRQSLKQA